MSSRRVDGDADLAHLALASGLIGVVAHLRRQVEGDREAGLPCSSKYWIARFDSSAEQKPGILAHRPEASAIHRRLDAAGVGIFAGIA